MKLRIEISDDGEDEIVIRCKNITDEIVELQNAVTSVIRGGSEMKLFLGSAEYYVRTDNILFFETVDGKITAHTSDNMYFTEYKLCELPSVLPSFFVRVSKSCIANALKVASIDKNLTGSSTVYFTGSRKKAYISRMYYNELKERINEMRFKK